MGARDVNKDCTNLPGSTIRARCGCLCTFFFHTTAMPMGIHTKLTLLPPSGQTEKKSLLPHNTGPISPKLYIKDRTK